MTTALLWLACGTVAALVTARVAAEAARSSPLRRRNYRGVEVPSAAGIAPLAGLAAGIAVNAAFHGLFPGAPTAAAAVHAGPLMLAAALGFGLIGLWDDLAPGEGRGWKAHASALVRGRATSGAIKLAVGGAIALALVAGRGRGIGWALVDAAVLAGTANAVNLLDLRPGRAAKGVLAGTIPLLAIGGPAGPALASLFGAVAAFLPFDLRERAMLGDAGANGLGAALGVAAVGMGSDVARLAVLAVLVLLHLLADGASLSRIIDRIPPLRRADRAGSVRAADPSAP